MTLDYQLGVVEIDKAKISSQSDIARSVVSHLYVVTHCREILTTHLQPARSHPEVVRYIAQRGFATSDKVIGGGMCRVESEELILDQFSGHFGGIPEEPAAAIAQLLAREFNRRTVPVTSTHVNPSGYLGIFWLARGYVLAEPQQT